MYNTHKETCLQEECTMHHDHEHEGCCHSHEEGHTHEHHHEHGCAACGSCNADP